MNESPNEKQDVDVRPTEDQERSDVAGAAGKLRVLDAEEKLNFIQRTARLRGVVDDALPPARREWLDQWLQAVGELGLSMADVERRLIDRARDGVVDLRRSEGRELADAVIDAQDHTVMVALVDGLISPRATGAVRAWAEEAERTPLDESAAAHLEAFAEAFPIRSDLRLACVDRPLSLTAAAMAAAVAPAEVIIEARWRRAAEDAPGVEIRPGESPLLDPAIAPLAHSYAVHGGYVADGGGSSDTFQSFVRAKVTVDVPDVGRVRFERQLDEEWNLVIDADLTGPAGGAVARPHVVSVHLAGWPASRPVPTDSTRWAARLRPLEPKERLALADGATTCVFSHGVRLRLRPPKPLYPVQ